MLNRTGTHALPKGNLTDIKILVSEPTDARSTQIIETKPLTHQVVQLQWHWIVFCGKKRRGFRRLKHCQKVPLFNMKLQVITFLASLLAGREATGFLSPSIMKPHVRLDSVMFSSLKEDETTASPAQATSDAVEIDPDAEGLPWWWELVWKLDMMKTGEPGEDIIFGDSANV